MRITAAICRDRADESTVKGLASLVQQSLPKHQYEILLIGDADLARLSGITEERSIAVPNLRWIKRPATQIPMRATSRCSCRKLH
jgi:hypothetical protein